MEQRKIVEQQIIEKAMKDEDFRRRLITDPRFTLEQETGMRIPDCMNIKVLEEDAQTFYLVLPPNPTISEDGELTEADLIGVSGGYDGNGQGTNNANSCSVYQCFN
jgi:hypothetical protein